MSRTYFPGTFAFIAIAVCMTSVDGGTSCLTYKHQYSSTSECGKQRKGFEVKRCAENSDALKTYVQGLNLDNRLTADTCKQMWLRGCSNFFLRDKYVVVPSSITCNSYICDQSSFYSNCVADADCGSTGNVQQGLPVANAVWPFANQTVLPEYRPCCSFFEKNCNGASCLGRDDSTCPLTFAQRAGFCQRENCWVAGPSAARRSSMSAIPLAIILGFGVLIRSVSEPLA